MTDWKLKISELLRSVLFLYVLAVTVNIVSLLLIRYKIRAGGGTLALHYNVLAGVDLYGRGYRLYTIPAVGLLVVAINAAFVRVTRTTGFLGWLTATVSVGVALTALAAVLFLARVN